MSGPEKRKQSETEPTIRLRQLCAIGAGEVLALSEEGVVYRRRQLWQTTWTVPVPETDFVWERLPVVSSTQLEVRRCTYPGCHLLSEVLRGNEYRCSTHRGPSARE
jgi:hypothetical protein